MPSRLGRGSPRSSRTPGTRVGTVLLLLGLLLASPLVVVVHPTGSPIPGASNGAAPVSLLVGAGLDLFPSSGASGTLVVAAGTGFSGNASISLTFDGGSVVSNCSTDANGSFPGASGTPCQFAVPLEVAGSYSVVASDGTTTASGSFFVGQMSLDPASGVIGSSVAASGIGPGPISDLAFTFTELNTTAPPRTLPSTCAANATGHFPGTTGTACTFLVPSALGGPANVTALGWMTSPTPTAVGSDPTELAYDSGKGELWVSDAGSSSVTVISATNHSVLANVSVQSDPQGVAYDPVLGEVFVADQGTDNVSVINDTNDSLVTTVAVGRSPIGVAYDSALDEIFVANEQTNTYGDVSVLAAANNTVIDTIDTSGSGTYPYAIAYDSGTGQMFVTNWDSTTVTVISDATNSIVATVGVGSAPWGIAYDPGTGEMFSANEQSNNVSVISDVTDTVVATVKVSALPYGVVYDPRTGEVLVSNYYSQTVSIISDATDHVLATPSVGSYLWGLVYASDTGQVSVADSGADNVSLLDAGEYGTATFTVNASLSLVTPTGTADAGETISMKGNGYGNALGIDTFSLGAYPLTCLSATNGSCVAGALTTAPNGTFIAEFAVPALATAGPYLLTVTDSDGNTAGATLVVNADPNAATPTATPASVDLGQSTTFAVEVAFGSGSYSYTWLGLPTGCAGSLASIVCSPRATGTFSVSADVTDSNGVSNTSLALPFTVSADPIVELPLANPGTGLADAGQSVTFTAPASLGGTPYELFSWSGLPAGCTGNTSTVTCSVGDLPAGQYSIAVNVTDSNGYTSPSSPGLSFLVNQDPTVSTPSSNHATVDVGQSLTFLAGASLGSGSYSYAWSDLPTGCTGVATASPSCTPTSAGSSSAQLEVTDSDGFSVNSSAVPWVVDLDPTANLTSTRTAVDSGESVSFEGQGAGGSGGYGYLWTGLPAGCGGDTATVDCTPLEPGSYSVRVKINDSNGAFALSPAIALVVASTLVASISASPNASALLQSVVFTSNVSGGTGPFTFAWVFGDGSKGSGSNVDHTFASVGNYTVTLWVNDSTGASVERSISVLVSGPSSSVAPASNTGTEELGITAAVVLALVVLAVVLWLRRRGGPSTSPVESSDLASNEEPGEPDSEGTADPSERADTESPAAP
ncbi:MAG: PKD domain-containing protein [Thermoplasmata archaeon]|nr:PKD domain-containing protein [Thermoplasmata archaeon]